VESAPRAYRLKASNAAPPISTFPGAIPGADIAASYPHAAEYVDRILRGEKAGDLPYQQPTKYELVINLKTAKALGLNVPLGLQQRADELIE